jgi:fumarate reductase subunit D
MGIRFRIPKKGVFSRDGDRQALVIQLMVFCFAVAVLLPLVIWFCFLPGDRLSEDQLSFVSRVCGTVVLIALGGRRK